MSNSQPLLLEHTLVGGKYRLGEVIGSGGVGTVFRATHLWTEREVAVKVLNPSLPHFDQLREAFLREARATVQLEHPNVVEVLDMGEDHAGTTYMVMELLHGPTLRDLLLERGSLSMDETAAILWPLLDALEMGHERGIVHKDFKPENIILSVDGFGAMTPKLLDFGVAQILRESQLAGAKGAHQVIVGTPQYMSPEQARDQRQLIGPQTDVWGVGVVWYECLTGRCPFDGDTPLEVLNAVCEAPLDFEGIDESQVPVLRRALERAPSKRTPSLARLRVELERAGVAGSRAGMDARSVSSRPPHGERPSYVRSTLQGVGPANQETTGVRSVQLDSELITLPAASHRKAALGGLALVLAVALAAWWTIGSQEDETEVPLSMPSAEEEAVPPAEEVAAPPAEEATAPPAEDEAANPPDPTDAVEALATPSNTEPDSPPIITPPAATATKTTKTKRQNPPSDPRPAAPREYQRPPDLVTEW